MCMVLVSNADIHCNSFFLVDFYFYFYFFNFGGESQLALQKKKAAIFSVKKA